MERSSYRNLGRMAFVFVLLLLGQPLCAAQGADVRLSPTLATHTGPWYEPGAPEVHDVRADLGVRGPALLLRGRVLDVTGRPVSSALIEYWHTDAAGNYPPLRASTRTTPDGEFRIRTILPGHNGGYRARHIHFVLTHPNQLRLVTRIYFRGDENMDEAPWPELAITLEEALQKGERRYFGNLLFVMR